MQERMRRVVLFMASAPVPPHRAQIDFGAPVDNTLEFVDAPLLGTSAALTIALLGILAKDQ